jgi:hypothetical protein
MSIGFSDRTGLGPQTAEERKARVTVAGRVVASRPKSILLVEDGQNGVSAWLPKSQIEIERGAGVGVRVSMPAWLAAENGFSARAGGGQGALFD